MWKVAAVGQVWQTRFLRLFQGKWKLAVCHFSLAEGRLLLLLLSFGKLHAGAANCQNCFPQSSLGAAVDRVRGTTLCYAASSSSSPTATTKTTTTANIHLLEFVLKRCIIFTQLRAKTLQPKPTSSRLLAYEFQFGSEFKFKFKFVLWQTNSKETTKESWMGSDCQLFCLRVVSLFVI